MKRAIIGLYTLLFVFATFIAVPQSSQACSCAQKPSVAEELERKTAIFAGKVVKISGPHLGFFSSTADPVTVTFAVSAVWKGEAQAELNVNTPISDSSCGFSFEMSREYLVYASSTGSGKYTTMLCDGTKLLSGAAEDLTVLGTGEKPIVHSYSLKHLGGIPPLIYVAVAISFATALFLCYWGIQMGYGFYLTRTYIHNMSDIHKRKEQEVIPSKEDLGAKRNGEKLGKRMGAGLISFAAAAGIAVMVYVLLMNIYTN